MAAKKKEVVEPAPVSQADFQSLLSVVGDLAASVKALHEKAAAAPVAPETPLDKEIAKAAPDSAPINPEWDEKAKEILGEALERCEVQYLKRGGTVFTVVIKNSHSNASKDYLERMKADRRSKEIGNEGIEGVEQWCKLVASNLKKATATIN